jgi:hypothetical protein
MERSELLAIIEKAKQNGRTILDLSQKLIEELPETVSGERSGGLS